MCIFVCFQAFARGDRDGSKITALSANAKQKPKTKKVTIASGALTLRAAQSGTLALKLNATGRNLLARYGKLTSTVVVTANGTVIKKLVVHITKATKTKPK